MKKIIISISVVVAALLLSFSIFAAEGIFEKGPHYDESHDNYNCCTVGSDETPHYDYGYQDGWLDGYDKQQPTIDSQQDTINSQQATIESLMNELNQDPPQNPDDPNNPPEDSGENPENPDNPSSDDEWKKKYYELLVMYQDKVNDFEQMTEMAANYVVAFQGANQVIADLGGQQVSDPYEDLNGEEPYYGKQLVEVVRVGAVQDFANSMESILNGDSKPVEGSTEAQLAEAINNSVNSAFSDGLAAGANQYKGSKEYETALNSEYEAGSRAGQTVGYTLGVDEGYAKGLLDGAEAANEALYVLGKTEYKSTQEYEDAINDSYDDGYRAGKDAESGVSIISVIIPASVALLLAAVIVALSRRRKI